MDSIEMWFLANTGLWLGVRVFWQFVSRNFEFRRKGFRKLQVSYIAFQQSVASTSAAVDLRGVKDRAGDAFPLAVFVRFT